MSKKRNKGQDKKPDFLADLNADILDDLTEKGRIRNAAGLAGELTELEEVTDICGLRFNGYLAKIETKRPSGIIDEVAVAFTEAAVDRGKTGDGLRLENYFLLGSRLLISGRQQALKDFKSGKVLVKLLGRCQSREYLKQTEKEILTAYEISVSFIKRIGEAGNEIKNNHK